MARHHRIPTSRKAFTLRINPEKRAALESLSKILGRPINQLVNEAIQSYLLRVGPAEQSLSDSLRRLRDYRHRDPNFDQAIAAFAEAEARYGKDDPTEGEVVVGDLEDGKLVAARSPGPAEREVYKLLDG